MICFVSGAPCLAMMLGILVANPPADFRQTASRAVSDDSVVLFDFQRIHGTITAIDETGVHWADGELTSWDRILQIKTASMTEEQVQRWIQEFGDPANRVRRRLEIGDFLGAGELAALMLDRLPTRECELAVLLSLARYRMHLQDGNLPPALVDYAAAVLTLGRHPEWRDRIPKSLDIPATPETLFPSSLLPLGTGDDDIARAAEALSALKSDRPPAEWPLTVQVIAAAMSIECAPGSLPEDGLRSIESISPNWAAALRLQSATLAHQPLEPAAIRKQWEDSRRWDEQPRLVARYWLGVQLLSDARHFPEAAVKLLSIPADFGDQYPELAALSLNQLVRTAVSLGDESTAEKLASEIRLNYSQTRVGRRMPAIDPKPKLPTSECQ